MEPNQVLFVSTSFTDNQKQVTNFKDLLPKTYIAFKTKSNIADIELQANALKLWINLRKGQLNDSLNIMRDVSNLKGHHGNGDYEIIVRDTTHLEYSMSLIKQAII